MGVIGGNAISPVFAPVNPFFGQQLIFRKASISNILATDTLTNPKILAEWKITRPPSPIEPQLIPVVNSFLNGTLVLDSGSGRVRMIWFSTPDNINFSSQNNIETNSASFIQRFQGSSQALSLADDTLFFGFALVNNDDLSAGRIGDMLAYSFVQLPTGSTLEQII